MVLSSFRCHYLSSIGDILILVWTLNEPQVKGKQKANSKAQTFSPYTQWENKCLFSWATLPHLLSFLSLLRPSIPRSCGFFITTLLSGRACSLLLAFTLAFFFLHLSTACGLTYTLASDVSHLILLTPLSLSPGGWPSANWGHLSACNGGLRLWSEVRPLTAQWRRTATTDAKTLESVCVCMW